MFQTLSYQQYIATEQRLSDLPSGRIAAQMRDLRLSARRAFRPRHRVRPVRRPIATTRVLPSER